MNTKLSFLYALLLSLVSFAQAANLPVSKSEQLGMTADEALSNLMDGNHRYAKGNLTAPNIKADSPNTVTGSQHRPPITSQMRPGVPGIQLSRKRPMLAGYGDLLKEFLNT